MSKQSGVVSESGAIIKDQVPPREDQSVSSSEESDGGVYLDSPKKRKREPNEENIEIDLSLPEPPNKKALRKAKKSKKVPPVETSRRDSVNDDGPLIDDNDAAAHNAPAPKTDAAGTKSSKQKRACSIWIGNLPFSATKTMITDFLTNHIQPQIDPSSITRVHVPAPANAKATKTTIKPLNKGFAYVDFADEQSFAAALALSEQPLAGRNLLIKDAKSFEGRPKEHQEKQDSGTNKIVSRRVFVGNLSFDATVEDLEKLFEKCGTIEHVHMATFEDSGKCKGFAWVTFAADEAAKSAVKGVVIEEVPDEQPQEKEDAEEDGTRAKRKPKKRQWWCNRLQGREVRREFAEDSSIRYQKRFGKKKEGAREHTEAAENNARHNQKAATKRTPQVQTEEVAQADGPGALTDQSKRRGRNRVPQGRDKNQKETFDETSARTRYRSGQVAESQGSKITFD
ncbi:MAG: hypothetical protein Q9162_003906 [Coniocarpon cinnabarinum]